MSTPSPLHYLSSIVLVILINGCHCKNDDIDNFRSLSNQKSNKKSSPNNLSIDSTKIVELPPVKNKGVINIGNSCYGNATIQMLASFYRELIAQKALKEKQDIAITGHELIKSITIPQENPDPHKLKTQSKEFFNSLEKTEKEGGIGWVNKCGSQEDADELLVKILDWFKLPMAQLQYKLINNKTREERLIENTQFPSGEPFINLELPISPTTPQTMQEVVNAFCSPEIIDDYKWDGNPTQVQKVPILRDLNKLYNKILIVTLKRYEYDPMTHIASKINKPITKPFRITCSQEKSPGKQEEISYELVGFIKHSGGTGSGHYLGYVKVDGKWIKYDDTQVKELSEAEAEQEAQKGYTFFYQQVK